MENPTPKERPIGLNNEITLNNPTLISEAMNLLNIAEMYFDDMQARGKTETIPFKIVYAVLTKINYDKTNTKKA